MERLLPSQRSKRGGVPMRGKTSVRGVLSILFSVALISLPVFATPIDSKYPCRFFSSNRLQAIPFVAVDRGLSFEKGHHSTFGNHDAFVDLIRSLSGGQIQIKRAENLVREFRSKSRGVECIGVDADPSGSDGTHPSFISRWGIPVGLTIGAGAVIYSFYSVRGR